jgi:hypothetical protein
LNTKRVTIKLSDGVTPDILSHFGLQNIEHMRLKNYYSALVAISDVYAMIEKMRSTVGIITADIDESVPIKQYP